LIDEPELGMRRRRCLLAISFVYLSREGGGGVCMHAILSLRIVEGEVVDKGLVKTRSRQRKWRPEREKIG